MIKNQTSSQKKRKTSVIWLLTSLGVLLLFLTTGLLAVRLQEMTGAEHTGTSEVTNILLGNTDALDPKFMVIKDKDENEWSLTTETIDLFQSSYENANGEVTVKSGEEDKVIAPGTSGTYSFSVENTGSTPLDYQLWLEKAFQVTGADGETVTLPVQVRLSSGSSESKTWLLGSSETVWVDASALKEIESDEAIQERASEAISENAEASADPQSPVTGTLDANESISYTLEWQWPYEMDADANDILLGNSEDTELTVKLIIAAEAEEPPADPIIAAEPSAPPETEMPDITTESPQPETPDIITESPQPETPDITTESPQPETPDTTTVSPQPETPKTTGSSEIKTPKTGDDTRFPWGWILGLIQGPIVLFLFLFLLWRRIAISGYLWDDAERPMEGCRLVLERSGLHKTKEVKVDEEGHFEIRWVPLGRNSLTLKDKDGNILARNELKLKRRGKLHMDEFLQIGEKKADDGKQVYTEFDVRYRITDFEIYLHRHTTSGRMEIELDRWVAGTWFSKKYTPNEEK
jgi:hypothetical protein